MTARQITGELTTVVEVARRAAEVNGDVEASVEPAVQGRPRRAMTFAAWDRAADGVAGLLALRGVERGSVVCLLLPSSLDYQIAYAAAVRLGAITSGINLRLGAPETSSILERTRPVVTVVDDGTAPPPGPTGTLVSRAELTAAAEGPAPRLPVLEPTDPVCVVWTSGTTGLPKGAVFDHDSLRAVADGIDVLSAPGDRRLSPLPFAHVGSMTRLWDELAHAVTTVITPTPWRAADAVRILAEERITVAQGVPTQWALMLDQPGFEGLDTSSLRIAGTGAARVPPELVVALRERLGVPAVVRYTSTETSLGTGTSPGDPVEVVTGTVGRPVPGVELELVADDGTPVGAGEVGRVRLRSGAVLRGYWGGPPTGPGADGVRFDEAATAAVLDDQGWVTTGDYGELDGAGNLVLRGRANELYLRGGYNVYPAEVEGALGGHPGVEQVAVVGAPDPVLGEIGVAFVVPTAASPAPDPATLLTELRDLARGRLADYKAPDRLVVVDALPLTSMLKVDKRALAAPAAEAAAAPPPGAGAPRSQPTPTKGAVP